MTDAIESLLGEMYAPTDDLIRALRAEGSTEDVCELKDIQDRLSKMQTKRWGSGRRVVTARHRCTPRGGAERGF